MRMWKSLGLATIMGLMPACIVSAQQSGSATDKDNKKPAPTEQVGPPQKAPAQAKPVPATTDPNYVIGAEDVLDVNVWNETQISRSVPVRPDGKISLPLLNDMQAAGVTPTQLGAHIAEGLKKFITDPQVTVIVTAVNSRRFYITGEVQRAGTYPLLPDMTVLQALASSGGFTTFANTSKIYVLRIVNGKQTKLPFNYKDVLNGKHPEQNVMLMPGDTIVIP
jgi:polysaccharide export outer membrane protein